MQKSAHKDIDHIDSGNRNFTDYLGNRVSTSMFLFDCTQ